MAIPGFTFITNGGTINLTPSAGVSSNLLLIGTAVDGPINEPINVRSYEDYVRLFGPSTYTRGYTNSNNIESNEFNGSSLAFAVQQAFRAGATNIYVVRASGLYATNNTAFSNSMRIRSRYPGKIYNSVSLVLADAGANVTLTLNQPASKGGNVVFTFPDATTVETVINTINNSPKNTTIFIDPFGFPLALGTTIGSLTPATVTLSGGANETSAPGEAFATSKLTYFTRLTTADTGTFDMIVNSRFQFSVACLTGIYADDEIVNNDATKCILGDFAVFLENASTQNLPCVGFIGANPILSDDVAKIIDHATNNWLATSTGFYDATRKIIKLGPFLNGTLIANTTPGVSIDLGRRVFVTVGDVNWTEGSTGWRVDSFHHWLAAKATTVPPENSLDQIPCPGKVSRYFPAKIQNLLASGVGADPNSDVVGGGAYISLSVNPIAPTGAPIVFNSGSAARRNDVYRDFQVINLSNALHTDLSNVLRIFLGKPFSPGIQQAMETAVVNVLEGYVASNGIRGGKGQGYDYQILSEGLDQAIGVVRVNLRYVPSRAISAIVQSLSVSDNIGGQS